jgi:hypothetical protein
MTPYDIIAFHQGELAYYCKTSCPYPNETSEFDFWHQGWHAALKIPDVLKDKPQWNLVKDSKCITQKMS